MPPKAKFTKDEIIAAALELVRETGADSLTARTLGAKLGSSPRPIFTVFRSMDEVQQAVFAAARACYNGYIDAAFSSAEEDGTPSPDNRHFKRVGAQYIRFAIREPKLFQLLFMQEQKTLPDLSHILPMIDENYEAILTSVQEDHHVNREDAQWLYRHLWIYTHGIASLCATGMCKFTAEEIGRMMTEVFIGLIQQRKGGMTHV